MKPLRGITNMARSLPTGLFVPWKMRSFELPSLCEIVGRRHRQCLVKKFPYRVIFRTEGDELYVVALAHTKRRSGYWKGRI